MSTSRARGNRWAWWPASGLILLVFSATLVTRADADLWGHTRFGIDILETWSLPSDDPYSFTQDKPWVNHEWLAELAMGLAWTLGGAPGLVLLKGILLSGTLAVVWTGLRRTRFAVQLGALAMIIAGSLSMTSPLRPQLWTYLCLAVLCRVLVVETTGPRRWLPLLFVVWANAHGGWVVGVGVISAWAAGEWWSRPDRRRQWAWLWPASVGATLVNPYGPGLWHFIATTVRPAREIHEWLPLWQLDGWYWIAWVLGVVTSIVALLRPADRHLSRVLVLAMLGYGGLRVFRIGSLFLLVAILVASPVFASRWPARRPARAGTLTEIVAGGFMVLMPLLLAMRLTFWAVGCIRPLPGMIFDARVVGVLSGADPGRLVLPFDWGQYALWHLGPGIRVSIDGRRETVYSDAALNRQRGVVDGTPAGLATLAEWRPEYVWLPASSDVTRAWLTDNGYRIVLSTLREYLAVRHDMQTPAVPSTEPVIVPCFPQ